MIYNICKSDTRRDNPMELRELRTFSVVAKLRSISKGAEALGIGQPTATTHIKKLEQELGRPLFDRVS
jgi:DNA-binding transcriptional LysR family regulator